MYCAFLHRKEIRGFSIAVGFGGRCWCLLAFGVFLVFVLGLFFLLIAPGTSCRNLEVLNTVLNKCETALMRQFSF